MNGKGTDEIAHFSSLFRPLKNRSQIFELVPLFFSMRAFGGIQSGEFSGFFGIYIVQNLQFWGYSTFFLNAFLSSQSIVRANFVHTLIKK